MYHIAIVEDEVSFAEQLQRYLMEYEAEHNLDFKISVFHDGSEILESYEPVFDVILFDIEMPEVDGMTAAGKIREIDSDMNWRSAGEIVPRF